jgi:hypothetical protein
LNKREAESKFRRKNMRRIAILGLVICFVFTADQARAQKLHVVLVGDTKDRTIGKGVKENIKTLETLLGSAERDGEISVSRTEIKGDDFNCKRIREAVIQLNIGSTDAVLFYYSGHGFRHTQAQFPEFDCRRTSDPDLADLSGIGDLIKAKKPRFLLAIADACNKKSRHGIPPRGWAPPYSPDVAFIRGGYFTEQLLATIWGATQFGGGLVGWEDIVPVATEKIYIQDRKTYQNPQSKAWNLVGS